MAISLIDRALTVNSTLRSPAPYRYPPLALLLSDIGLVLRNLLRLPSIIFPLWTTNPRGELYLLSLGNLATLVVHAALLVVGLAGFAVVGLFFYVQGAVWLVAMALYAALVSALAWLLNFARDGDIIASRAGIAAPVAGEKWFFINGVMAGRWWMQAAVDEIARRFGRPVDGIHNRT